MEAETDMAGWPAMSPILAAVWYGDYMAENFGSGYGGRYRDEYDAAAETDAAEERLSYILERYVSAVDYGGDEYSFDWEDESAGDEHLVTGAMDEPVDEVVDDPAAAESAAYQRIGRLKRSRRWLARARRSLC